MLGYMGPAGTFSQQAAIEWSRGSEEFKEFPTIASAIKAVDTGEIERCIVPIENSLNGSVTMTLDTLAFDANVYITGEYVLGIAQNLAVKKGTDISDIKVIMSHPQGLGQCSKMLESEFQNVELCAVESTAAAAKAAADGDGSIAAIAPAMAAKLYGLEIIRPECNDLHNNCTRFVIIEKQASRKVTERDKSSIVFELPHMPGSLHNVLGIMSRAGINMLKIESRPIKNRLGRYIFFIDIEGNMDNAQIYFALDSVRQNSEFYKFLGSYSYV